MSRTTAASLRRRDTAGLNPSSMWKVSATFISASGRHIEPGTELSIQGERGRFRFIQHVDTGDVEWIDVIGGPKGVRMWRSFRPDRIKRVHIKKTVLTNEEARQLVNAKNRTKRGPS